MNNHTKTLPAPDDLARQYVTLAHAHTNELYESVERLAEHVEVEFPTVISTLVVYVGGNEVDLDERQLEVLRQMHAVPGFAARVSCLRKLRLQQAAVADQLGGLFGWEPAYSREIMIHYWHSTTGDGHTEGFSAWHRLLEAQAL
jgi:hypothetical protein